MDAIAGQIGPGLVEGRVDSSMEVESIFWRLSGSSMLLDGGIQEFGGDTRRRMLLSKLIPALSLHSVVITFPARVFVLELLAM